MSEVFRRALVVTALTAVLLASAVVCQSAD